MQIIQSQPEAREICVEKVKGLRFAEANGTYDAVFQGLSQMGL
jgi:short-subunit dehydrogenase involved in D-alanine esterification of teichoic acids